MRRWLQSRQYMNDSFDPMLEVFYYDDNDFQMYETTFKLSAEFVHEINVRGTIDDEKIEGVDTFFDISNLGYNSCKEIETTKHHDVDIESIESEVKKNLKEVKSFLGSSDYNKHYENILENIKIYRRQRSLDNLGI